MNAKFWLFVVLFVVVGVPLLGLVTAGRTMDKLRLTRTQTQVAPDTAMKRETFGEVGRAQSGAGSATVTSEDALGAPTGFDTPSTTMIAPDIYPGPDNNGSFTEGVDRLVVKNATLSLVVADTQRAVSDVTAITQRHQGYVTSVNISESPTIYPMRGTAQTGMFVEEGSIEIQPVTGKKTTSPQPLTAYMTLRLPLDQLEVVMTEIRQLADRVVSETLSAQDETEQKIDLEAQIKNLQATEKQLQTLMSQAKNVQETLQVQRELTNTRGQIERLQAQIDNLAGSAKLATLQLTLTTNEADLPVVDETQPSIWEEVKAALRTSAQFYRDLFVSGLKSFIVWGPLALIALGVVWWWRRRRA